MKKAILGLFVGLMMVSGAFYVAAQGSAKKRSLVVGEVIDIANYAMKNMLGEEGKEAGVFHAKGGYPIGIFDAEKGEVFVCVYKNPAPASGLQPANDILVPFMGMKVAAQGYVYRARGANVIQISIVSEY